MNIHKNARLTPAGRQAGVRRVRDGESVTAVAELRRLKELEQENARLKRMYADLALENAAIQEVLSRKL